jgi:hypothetical protein
LQDEEYMLSKRMRKRSASPRKTGKKRKPARRTSLFKSMSWYQAAARAIAISPATLQ